MRSLVATVLCAVTLVSLAGTATAARPTESAALFRVVATLVGSEPTPVIPVVEESSARYEARRAALAVRGYSASAQAHDAAVLDALGIDATPKTLAAAVVATQRQVALYDARTHRVHLLRDAPDQKAAIARAFVSGLQNRQYGLGRAAVTDRDARLAELAAGQGHAALVAARIGRVPAVPARGSRLERFVALESSFTSSVGLRFAATLQNLGGRRAVATALARRPESTEQIFHIDKFLERERPAAIPLPSEAAGLRRVSVGSFGELDVRTLLAVVGAPAVDATGTGWAGGRTAIYRGDVSEAAVVALAWDSARDADQWAAVGARLSGTRVRLVDHPRFPVRSNVVLAGRRAQRRLPPVGHADVARDRRERGRGSLGRAHDPRATLKLDFYLRSRSPMRPHLAGVPPLARPSFRPHPSG